MNQSKPTFDEKIVRNATWTAVLLTAAGLAFFGFAISIVSFTDWQDYILVGFPLVLAGASLASIFIMRRGHVTLGSGIVFAVNLVVPLLMVFIIMDTLWAALSYAAVSSALIIWRSLPYRSWRWSIIVAVAAMVTIVVVDINAPTRFPSPPAFNTFVVVLISILSVAFVVQAVRQTWGRSMRNKLLAAFIGVTVVATSVLAVYVYITTDNILRQGLENELSQHTDGVANQISNLLTDQINQVTVLSLSEVLQQAVERENQTYPNTAAEIQAILDAKDTQWRAADAADNNRDPLVREHLTNDVAQDLLEYQRTFPNHVEVFITDVYGGLTGTTNRTSDYYQADEAWWQAAYNNGDGAIYISEPEYDDSAKALAFQIAMPIRNRDTGKIIGILRTTYLASALTPILGELVGETGETNLFIPGEDVYYFDGVNYEEFDQAAFNEIQAATTLGMAEIDYESIASVVLKAPVQNLEGNQAVDNLGWVVLFHQQQNEAFSPVNVQSRGLLVVMAIILVLAVGAAIGFSVFLVRPITQLTQTAEELAAGNLNSRANVTSTDEIGTLASTFNSMTSQLQETLQGLEQRVAARTRDLEIVAEVGTATATILESKRLLQEVVDLTKERFKLYHSHIYLLDEKGENLVLTAGAGEPGRVMVAEGRSIPLNREQSLVARAAREGKGVIVNDVTLAPDFLPNVLLPNTRSELAVPMIVGGRVIGVFDIQSDKVDRFTDSDINIQTTLASQLATSIQNVRSFEQSKIQADYEALVNTIGQKIQRSTTVEDTLQIAIRELGSALGATRVKANISARKDGINN